LLALTAAYATEKPDNRIRLAAPQAAIHVLPGFEAKLWRGTFSPSGNALAIASFDRPLRVAIWHIARPTAEPLILEVADGGAATAITFSRDEALVAVSDLRSCVYVWRVAASATRVSHCDRSEMPGELDFDPSGSRLAVGLLSGGIRIFHVSPEGLHEERRLDGHRESTTALSFDASGRWLTSASRDGELRFWETTTWQPVGVTRDPDDSFVRQIVAGPGDGRIVVLTQGGRRISVWDLDTDRAAAHADRLSRGLVLDTAVDMAKPQETTR
jgi:WD40 repeat protein